MIYITATGERVRRFGNMIDVGLCIDSQEYIGEFLYFDAPPLGKRVQAGDHLFVVQGKRGALEFYAPVSGIVKAIARGKLSADQWFVTMMADKHDP